jgi:hypothetical protein
MKHFFLMNNFYVLVLMEQCVNSIFQIIESIKFSNLSNWIVNVYLLQFIKIPYMELFQMELSDS